MTDKKNPFDDFSGDFNDFIKYIQRMFEDVMKNMDFTDIEKLFESGDASNLPPFVWGFSFNKGPDGKTRFEQFGDFMKNMGFSSPFKKAEEEEDKGRVREPIADIIEEPAVIRVIIELPGVEKNQIELNSTEFSVKVKAKSDTRTYRKDIELPNSVIPEQANAKFTNGVLEIILPRSKAEDSTRINID